MNAIKIFKKININWMAQNDLIKISNNPITFAFKIVKTPAGR